MPGGFIDPGETAEEALVREVREETGVEVFDLNYLASFPNDYAYGGIVSSVTDLFFVARAKELSKTRRQEGEIDDIKLLPVNEVKPEDFAFRTHQQALSAYLARMNAQ